MTTIIIRRSSTYFLLLQFAAPTRVVLRIGGGMGNPKQLV